MLACRSLKTPDHLPNILQVKHSPHALQHRPANPDLAYDVDRY